MFSQLALARMSGGGGYPIVAQQRNGRGVAPAELYTTAGATMPK